MAIDQRRNALNSIERARQVRRDMTWPEKQFWGRVKAQQFLGFKVRKQHAIGPFVVDFYCASVSLVVEIDGDIHVDLSADATRPQYLERLGLNVVRYSNDEMLKELDWVMEDLERRLRAKAKEIPPLTPPFEEGNQSTTLPSREGDNKNFTQRREG